MKSFFFVFTIFCMMGLSTSLYAQDPVDYADPLIGTWGFTGGVIPGISHPFGMTHFTPMTRGNKVGSTPYHYEDSTYMLGFRATHQPTVWMGDYGYSSLMPGIGRMKVKTEDRKLRYSHKDETAKVHYYAVNLQNDKNQVITARLTGARRCGFLQLTFPASDSAFVIAEAVNNTYPDVTVRNQQKEEDIFEYKYNDSFSGFVEVFPEKSEIVGFNNHIQSHTISPPLKNFRGFFVMRFSKPFQSWGTWSDTTFTDHKRVENGKHVGAFCTFKTTEGESVEVLIGTSFISFDEARRSIDDEIGSKTFDQTLQQTRTAWNNALSRITIETKDEVKKRLFYTFMFHAQQYPRDITENDHHYSAAFDKVVKGPGYTDFSLWDTYRAAHPLLIYLAPDRVNDMISSMLEVYDATGRLPVWPNPMETNIMIGSHADAVIADAYVKGFTGFDAEKAFAAMIKNGTVPPENDQSKQWGDRDPWYGYEGRGGLSHYLKHGYVASDYTKESVARTLEYSFDDYCISNMAAAMKKDKYHKLFEKQSRNYRNLYDRKSGYFFTKDSKGKFHRDPHKGFTEGDFWVYAFGVPHDVEGLATLSGGAKKLVQKIDSNYVVNGYSQHGNEQVHHYPYLYNYLGVSWKTQLRVTETIKTYKPTPFGIGNEDCGQMSAWFVFSTIGFYPVRPSTKEFAIGSPQVDKAVLSLGEYYDNRTFTVVAENRSDKNIYIKEAYLNDKLLSRPFISHDDIVNGGSLRFIMTDVPNPNWK